ncbi:toll/interleukin-1 receptor domain-containing protein [Leptolyngbya sp. CCNP1308]|uniref:toll/interleukin-1 receptor domain-containing protein n=1 Tax=Leptolyngbya sp. CCNP1308 TaxID=3110255 RepID=UPI002B205515|nr:toll/interleukin-1 receptor domain-containing protein [Leptolyngbya sp. CCNP1308]MEA5451235.1 toll/interleukin-1 receptor domain-containing protein [Leptolyngbya sp. CCNP1308]
MPLIFLSYRRFDSTPITRNIHNSLAEAYGSDTIFLDEKSIPKGADIRDYIRDMLSQCAVVLPVIASGWLSRITSFGFGPDSWEQPNDWVRMELEEALANNLTKVVPLLIDGIDMPRADLLPDGLKALTYRNGFHFSSEAFNEDMPRLIRELNRMIDGTVLALPEKLLSQSDDEASRQAYYRHEVRYCLESNDGQLDEISQIYLDALRQHLQLTRESTKRIQDAAQQPYSRYTAAVRQLFAHQTKMTSGAEAAEAFSTVVLDRRALNHLDRLHHNLALPQWKALRIRHQIEKEWEDRHRYSSKPVLGAEG